MPALPDEADLHLAAATLGEGVFEGVGDRLVQHQPELDRTLGRQPVRLGLRIQRDRPQPVAGEGLGQVVAEPDHEFPRIDRRRVLGRDAVLGQSGMHSGQGHGVVGGLAQPVAGGLGGRRPGPQQQDADQGA